jgi:hypothetical protein
LAVAAGANKAVIDSLCYLGATFTNAADTCYSKNPHRNLPVLSIALLGGHHELTQSLLANGADPLVIPPDLYLPDVKGVGDPNADAALEHLERPKAASAKNVHQGWLLAYNDWETELRKVLIPFDKYWLTRAVMMRSWPNGERCGF